MGTGASIAAVAADTFASANLKQLTSFDFKPVFEKLPIEELCTLDLALDRIKDKLRAVMERKFAAQAAMPDEAKALCDGDYANGSDRHKQLIKATVPYVVDIARHAHVSPLLKANLRRLLGLGPASPSTWVGPARGTTCSAGVPSTCAPWATS